VHQSLDHAVLLQKFGFITSTKTSKTSHKKTVRRDLGLSALLKMPNNKFHKQNDTESGVASVLAPNMSNIKMAESQSKREVSFTSKI
jgi:hypothetical protein